MNFCATTPLFWDIPQKPLAVEMVCVKNDKSFKTRYFLLTRHVNFIFLKLWKKFGTENWFRKLTYASKMKNLSKRNIFSLLDTKTLFLENMEEFRHKKKTVISKIFISFPRP